MLMQTDKGMPSHAAPFVVGMNTGDDVVCIVGMFRPFRYHGTDGKRTFPVITIINFSKGLYYIKLMKLALFPFGAQILTPSKKRKIKQAKKG